MFEVSEGKESPAIDFPQSVFICFHYNFKTFWCLHLSIWHSGQMLRAIVSPRLMLLTQTQEQLSKICIFLIESLHTINLQNFEHRKQRKSTNGVQKKKLLPMFKKPPINQDNCFRQSV